MAALKALMLHSENTAVGKYRIWTPAKYLKKLGWEVETMEDAPQLIDIDHKTPGDGCWECRAQGADIIIMQRSDNPESIALGLALREQCNAPLVIEVDDNIYDVAKSSTQYQYWYPGSPYIEIAEILFSQADAMTVSTPALVDAYKHVNNNIWVLPNYQDCDEWEVGEDLNYTPRPHGITTVVGWQGSSTHYDDLHMIRRPMSKFLRNNKSAMFYDLGLNADFLANKERVHISVDWCGTRDWPKRLQELNFDIGLAPVTYRPFNLGKSNIKWQEYSMAGIPTIASNVGEYKQIRHGVDGFLASNESEWLYYLEILTKDPSLREKIAREAKRRILTEFNMGIKIGLWDQAYRAIIQAYKTKHGIKQNQLLSG